MFDELMENKLVKLFGVISANAGMFGMGAAAWSYGGELGLVSMIMVGVCIEVWLDR